MDDRKKSSKIGKDKSPYLRREEKDTSKAFKSVNQSVKPVAKDTNKTRRKTTRARIVGDTVKTERPASNLKKALSKACKRCC
jgi:predicted  nucleic acid-binding Zn-ribbon protein